MNEVIWWWSSWTGGAGHHRSKCQEYRVNLKKTQQTRSFRSTNQSQVITERHIMNVTSHTLSPEIWDEDQNEAQKSFVIKIHSFPLRSEQTSKIVWCLCWQNTVPLSCAADYGTGATTLLQKPVIKPKGKWEGREVFYHFRKSMPW